MLRDRPEVGQEDWEPSDGGFRAPFAMPIPAWLGSNTALRPVSVAGRTLQPTPVFESYWRFAEKRHRVYLKRLAGESKPWTDDPILSEHRFTNAFRAADRVSQYLIRNVIYEGNQEPDEITFRVLLFKFFNKIDTWERLCSSVGTPSWASYDFDAYRRVLTHARSSSSALYSAAYVVPPPRLGEPTKHENHLRLLELMMRSMPDAVMTARHLRDIYEALTVHPSVGRFIGFQLTIDLNYSSLTAFSEMDFVVAGPGARDGLRKCFGPASDGIEDDLIKFVTDNQRSYFEGLGLSFGGLFGRPLQLVDCQNLFCEVDKYARVAHPEVAGHSGRSRIKQRFRPRDVAVTAWFPPKWGLCLPRPG